MSASDQKPSLAALIGGNVRAQRRRTKSSRSDFAKKVGLPIKLLKEIENGERLVSLSELEVLAAAIGVGISDLLSPLTPSGFKPAITGRSAETRLGLAKQFIESTLLGHYRHLVAWQSVTAQTSQIDSGYLGQHLVTLLTGIPGRGKGSRGKGDDLADGSEVKVASALGGTDVPRWNHYMRSGDDVKRLLQREAVFYVLIDTTQRGVSFPVRVRVWRVRPTRDKAFAGVVMKWNSLATARNFQLHPPCWSDDDVCRNESGNLQLPIMLEAIQLDVGDIDYVNITRHELSPGKCKPAKRADE